MKSTLIYLYFFLQATISFAQITNTAPVLNATGNQPYCAGTAIPIATSMTITDPDDLGTAHLYIQISNGYQQGQDLLTLTGTHPNVTSSWNANTGKLTLSGITSQPTYTELIAAVLAVTYQSTAPNPSGTRSFSISVGDANFLPSTGHFYLYVPSLGITWTSALAQAAASTYFGLQGYLATLTTLDEAVFSGNQASGTGWIGASDSQTEGQWRWMSGPEAGTNLTFSYWNNGEPNNLGDEDYAHITAPGVGLPGSWNDMTNTGEPSGNYQPKGYIVEFGGMPGDPVLQISTSTTIYIPQITQTVDGVSCGPGTITLSATTNATGINWFTAPIGGTPIATGNQFTTPLLTTTTVYYTEPSLCSNSTRVPVTATVLDIPIVTITANTPTCAGLSTLVSASTTVGQIRWYDSPTATQALASGSNFTTPILSGPTTFYVEANNNGCRSSRIAVPLTVYPTPNLGADEIITVCENKSATLAVFYPSATYSWSTGQTTASIIATNPGLYTVTVTTPFNCADTKIFEVQKFPLPIISSIDVNGLNVQVNMTQTGTYEYSIDGIVFQDSPFFTLATGGHYIMTVREKHGCGLQEVPFLANVFPSYFTPNGDGINDSWSGMGIDFTVGDRVTVFDRFGKVITVLSIANPSWQGMQNGKPAPADDYWYFYESEALQLNQRGHFSLKR